MVCFRGTVNFAVSSMLGSRGSGSALAADVYDTGSIFVKHFVHLFRMPWKLTRCTLNIFHVERICDANAKLHANETISVGKNLCNI